MAWAPTPMQATEAKANETLTGNFLLANGAFYLQYGSSTAIANTTSETSVFLGTPTTWSGTVAGSYAGPSSTLTLPAGSLSAGTTIQGYLEGIIQTSGTPTIRIRPGIVGPGTSTTFTALADFAATAMTAAAAGSYFRIWFNSAVTVGGSSGTIRTIIGYAQGTTAAASTVIVKAAAPQDVASLDLTQQYALDIRTTWGAASASNTLQIQCGWISLVG